MHIKGFKGQAAALLSLRPVVYVARLLSIISPDVCAPSAARLEIAPHVFLSVLRVRRRKNELSQNPKITESR